ncbi:MAG: AmmeMemoRadiSam system radical SAM enzyme [Planctomycetes bacterium]|nr:AmmeMemoRadiSam system radical SAM enzyme [Planctomycetota bacterium]
MSDEARSRRSFLRSGACALGALPLGLGALDALAADPPRRAPAPAGAGPNPAPAGRLLEVDPRFWKALPEGKTQCLICPLDCVLAPGQTCFCRTRQNHDGRMLVHSYGNPCIVSVDPVEKLPLAHFLPATQTLSIAAGGCNLRCLYCQNWASAQAKPDDLKNLDLPVAEAVEAAAKRGVAALAYTYTEPVAFYEYMRDLSEAAKARGLRNLCASALFINPPALRALARTVDAFAVALKGFDEKFYDRVLGSRLAPVLTALETLRAEKTWFEIVNLVVPTMNDDPDQVRAMARWIARTLGPDVPLHFGRFVPEYKLKELPRTPVETLERCRAIALEEGLRFVYIFNVAPHDGNHTWCPKCKGALIRRLGFKVTENRLVKGACPTCGEKIPGIWT